MEKRKDIGVNDPCPCGSGKKYKKCCWQKEFDLENEARKAMAEFEKFYTSFKSSEKLKTMAELDSIYASVKRYNNDLLHKANAPHYIGANFYDAIDLAITSNALSLIKAKFQTNHYSITNALNLRNLIECFTLLFMDKQGDISAVQKRLFVEQYKLIEYESYAKGDSNKYISLLDKEDLKARYEDGKAKFLEVLGDEKQLKKIVNSRLPFMCEEDLNYNILIEKYCPQFLHSYIYLSRMVHPSSYDNFRDKELYNTIYWAIMRLVIERYKDKRHSLKDFTYYKEQANIYGLWVHSDDNYGLKLFDILMGQIQILDTVAAEFQRVYGEKSYVKNFLNEVVLVLHDVNTDSQLGYTELVKLKFKVIAEMFACFHKVYIEDVESIDYFYTMLLQHDIIKKKEQLNGIFDKLRNVIKAEQLNDILKEKQSISEITEKDRDNIYGEYLKKYPSSKLTRDKFFKKFDKSLGFLVDGEGNSPNFVQLVDEYFENMYDDVLMTGKDVKIKDFCKLVYKESNNMSHGCGYLFFANIGAWMDEISVLQFLDNSIMHFLFCAGKMFAAYAEESDDNKALAELLKGAAIEMKLLYAEKMEILKKKNVRKNF